MKYVIKYSVGDSPGSYYARRTMVGPAFGATLATTPRFTTKQAAQMVIAAMPVTAGVCCDVEEIKEE